MFTLDLRLVVLDLPKAVGVLDFLHDFFEITDFELLRTVVLEQLSKALLAVEYSCTLLSDDLSWQHFAHVDAHIAGHVELANQGRCLIGCCGCHRVFNWSPISIGLLKILHHIIQALFLFLFFLLLFEGLLGKLDALCQHIDEVSDPVEAIRASFFRRVNDELVSNAEVITILEALQKARLVEECVLEFWLK